MRWPESVSYTHLDVYNRQLLFHFEQLYQIAADISASHQKLRCGISPMVGSCIFPHIYNEYHKRYPEIQVEMITEKGIYSLYDMLQKDQLDVLLVPGLDIPETFASYVIREERLLFCISQKYMSGCQDTITAVELSKIPLVIMPPGHLQHKLVMNFFQSNHLEPNVDVYKRQIQFQAYLVHYRHSIQFIHSRKPKDSRCVLPHFICFLI